MRKYQAVLFDLDGVVTDTAALHAAAWKEIFDPFLQPRGEKPFDIQNDYFSFVDGKSRYEGAKKFLESRAIDVTSEVIADLIENKNRCFRALLEKEGVRVYKMAVRFLRYAIDSGLKTAVVSSSKNCKEVLEAAGIKDLFQVRVDGEVIAEKKLRSKPEPDSFLEAAKLLGVKPEHAIVVEDARAGVQAGKRGGFGLVIGIDVGSHADELYKVGADIVVKHKMPSLFLDYDGTLTPIVSRSEEARLTSEMISVLKQLPCCVAIISGRDLSDVVNLVGIDSFYYAGSHGFEMCGPGGFKMQHPVVEKFLPDLERIQNILEEKLEAIDGCRVERKKFAIAVHYRLVSDKLVSTVSEIIQEIAGEFSSLRLRAGKKIYEFLPNIDWDKGKALLWLIEKLQADNCIYIGDDVTDEDALKAVKHKGIGIVVSDQPRQSEAHFCLASPKEVCQFLKLFIEL